MSQPVFSNRYYYSEVYTVIKRLVETVARPGMIGVDVGCLDGSSSFPMLAIVKEQGGTAYLIDWFRGSPETVVGTDWRYNDFGEAEEAKFPTGGVLENLIRNIWNFGYSDTAIVVATLSHKGAVVVADGSVDYCFIAADHRYTPVKRDIEAWWPKMREGGTFAGHAYECRPEPDSESWSKMMAHCEEDFADNAHYGVIRAVTEKFGDYESFGFDHSVWWVRK